jgi:hypothetical protein
VTNIVFSPALQAPIALAPAQATIALLSDGFGAAAQATPMPNPGGMAVLGAPVALGLGVTPTPAQTTVAGAIAGIKAGSTTFRPTGAGAAAIAGSVPSIVALTLSAPVITSLNTNGVADPTTTLRCIHTLDPNADHYVVRTKWSSSQTYTRFAQFNHTGSQIDITGNPPNQSIDVEIGSSNLNESVIIWSQPATAVTASATATIKWNPGFGVQATLVSSGDSQATVQNSFNLIASDGNFNHCHLIIVWSYIEGATQGVYDWSKVDAAFNYAKSIGKRFVLEIWWQTFGVNPSNPTSGTQGPPAYIINNNWWYVDSGPSTLMADFSIGGVQTAYAKLLQAVSNRYDSDPAFEGFCTAETASSRDNCVGLLTALQSARSLGAFPTSNVWVMDNFGATGTAEQTFVAGYTALKIGGGGPDTLNGSDTGGESYGQLTFRGAGNIASGPNAGNWGTIDYRGRYPNSVNRQGPQGSQTYAEMFAYWTQQKVDHVSFSSGNWPTAATQVAANPNSLWTTYPTGY